MTDTEIRDSLCAALDAIQVACKAGLAEEYRAPIAQAFDATETAIRVMDRKIREAAWARLAREEGPECPKDAGCGGRGYQFEAEPGTEDDRIPDMHEVYCRCPIGYRHQANE